MYMKILQTLMLSDKGELPGCTYGIESSAALQFLRCFTSPKNQFKFTTTGNEEESKNKKNDHKT